MPSGWSPTSIVPPGTGASPAVSKRSTRLLLGRRQPDDALAGDDAVGVVTGRDRLAHDAPAALVDARERVVLGVGDPHRARVVDGDAVGPAADRDRGDGARSVGRGRRGRRAAAFGGLRAAFSTAGAWAAGRRGGRPRHCPRAAAAEHAGAREDARRPARRAWPARGSSGARSASRGRCRRRRASPVRARRCGGRAGARGAGAGRGTRAARGRQAAQRARARGSERRGCASPRARRARRGPARPRSRSARRGPWPAPARRPRRASPGARERARRGRVVVEVRVHRRDVGVALERAGGRSGSGRARSRARRRRRARRPARRGSASGAL